LQTAPRFEDATQSIPRVEWREHQASGECDTINSAALYRTDTRVISEKKQQKETDGAQQDEPRTDWILF
jgi:hypothetical protein